VVHCARPSDTPYHLTGHHISMPSPQKEKQRANRPTTHHEDQHVHVGPVCLGHNLHMMTSSILQSLVRTCDAMLSSPSARIPLVQRTKPPCRLRHALPDPSLCRLRPQDMSSAR
jgi:hypothetical protein